MREPIGYIPLCEHLLNQGVITDVIIKHRWAMQAIGKYAVKVPVDVDFDQKRMRMTFVDHDREIAFDFDRMSGKAEMTVSVISPDLKYADTSRPTEGNIEFAFAWLYTATAQWAWYLRVWVWLKEMLVNSND